LALKYCHDQNVLHGDIKTSNIFLADDGSIKLGDFGTATNLAKTIKSVSAMTGTPLFFAPEIIHGQGHSFKADVWALGVVFYQMLALKFPFFDTNFGSLLGKILEDPLPDLPDHYSTDLKDFVGRLLTKNEDLRPEMDLVCGCEWFRNALNSHPDELTKMMKFQPQMRIRITENFLKREFDAIRVFRFSEDKTSEGQQSFRFSSANSNSFFDIFQSQCVSDADPKRTQKLLSRFANQINDLESSHDLSDESKLLDDNNIPIKKTDRLSQKSTNGTDKGVQIENGGIRDSVGGWSCASVGVLVRQNSRSRQPRSRVPAGNPIVMAHRYNPTYRPESLRVPSFGCFTQPQNERPKPSFISPILESDRGVAFPPHRKDFRPSQRISCRPAINLKAMKQMTKSRTDNDCKTVKTTQPSNTPLIKESAPGRHNVQSHNVIKFIGRPVIGIQRALLRPERLSKKRDPDCSQLSRSQNKSGLTRLGSKKPSLDSGYSFTKHLSKPVCNASDSSAVTQDTDVQRRTLLKIVDMGGLAMHKRVSEIKSKGEAFDEYSICDPWERKLTHKMIEDARMKMIAMVNQVK
jgi:serine/threonine protein kinase